MTGLAGDGVADVAVIGGGVIGLAVAWRAAGAGASVVVCDPDPGGGASWAAAGMLAPVTESRVGEAALTELCIASLRRWGDFARQLEEASGCPVGLRTEGTVAVAVDGDDRRALDHLAAIHRDLGLASRPLTGRECRQLEPLLTPRVRGGLDIPGDHQVDNRLLVAALQVACAKEGVETVAAPVVAVEAAGGRVGAVVTEGGETIAAGCAVLAAGCRSPEVALPAGAGRRSGRLRVRLPVRPVKGQILRLRAAPELAPSRTVRALVRGVPVYVVPRTSGQVVVGGTMEEMGFDTTVTAGAVADMLRAAVEVLPAVAEMELVDAVARLRPATPDNGPILGPGPLPGLIYATGHHRNGILLTPITADAVAASAGGAPMPEVTRPFSWERFG